MCWQERIYIYLKGIKVFFVEIISSSVGAIINELLADLTVLKAAPNSPPVIINPSLQPMRVISKPILLIPFPRQGFPCPLIGHHKSKDSETEEKHNEQEHNKKIDP